MGLKGGNNANIHLTAAQKTQLLANAQLYQGLSMTLVCTDPNSSGPKERSTEDSGSFVRNYNCILRGENLNRAKPIFGSLDLERNQTEGFGTREKATLNCSPAGGLQFTCALWRK